MKDLSRLIDRFDVLVDRYGDGSDPIAVEDVHEIVGKKWLTFVTAGVDIQRVVDLLSDKDVWENYNALKNCGATINAERFLNLDDDYDDFIDENWDLLIERGVSKEALVDRMYYCGIEDIDEVAKLLDRGVGVDCLFSLYKDSFDDEDDCYVGTWFTTLELFYEHGLSAEKINEFLRENLTTSLLEDIVGYRSYGGGEWSHIGVDTDDFLRIWRSLLPDDYAIKDLFESDLTTESIDACIAMYSVDELIKSLGDYDLWSFKYNGDIDAVAKRILDEKGYPEDADFSLIDAYSSLLHMGSKTINKDEVCKCLESTDRVPDGWKETFRFDLAKLSDE